MSPHNNLLNAARRWRPRVTFFINVAGDVNSITITLKEFHLKGVKKQCFFYYQAYQNNISDFVKFRNWAETVKYSLECIIAVK